MSYPKDNENNNVSNDDLMKNTKVIPAKGSKSHILNSDAFSFYSFTRGSVDPRTGTFNFALPLVSLKGNNLRGSSLNLSLKFSPFNSTDEGFGIGWSLGLSNFNKATGRLSLRDGRTIHIKENETDDTHPVIETIGVKDFTFVWDSDNKTYEIKYKDGSVEVLNVIKDKADQGIYRIVSVTDEAGYKLNFEYKDTILEKIYDMDRKVLVDFNYVIDMNIIDVNVFPDSKEYASTLRLQLNQNRNLQKCFIPKHPSNIYEFEYATINNFTFIKTVKNTGGFLEEIWYNAVLRLPEGAPNYSIPAVSSHKFTMYAPESNVYTEKHDYTYSDHNFMGYQEGISWDTNAIDNLYLRDSSYTYGSVEKLYRDDIYQYDISRTYNKYHLIIEEEITPMTTDWKIKHNYCYYADTQKSYKDLLPQYKYIKQKETVYSDNGKKRTELTEFNYDEYGNILLIDRKNSIKQRYQYDSPNKDGFVRHPTKVEEYMIDENYSTRTEYSYIDISGINNNTFTVTESIKEVRIQNGIKNERKEVKFTYYRDPDIPLTNGLPREKHLFLSGKFVSKESFIYTIDDVSPDTIQITNITDTTDGKKLTKIQSNSLWNGLVLLETDSTGVKTNFTYDPMGRLVSVTTGFGTSYAATTTYTYNMEESNLMITETSPDHLVKQTYLDGLQNECLVKFGKNQKVIRRSKYNTLNQLIESHSYDYSVMSIENNDITIDIADKYSYDIFGKVSKIEYNNGIVYHAKYDMVQSSLTEYLKYTHSPNKISKHIVTYNESGKITLEEYTSGKGKILKSIQYQYDEFNNLKTETITILNSDFKPFVKEYSYDIFDRIYSIKEGEQDSNVNRVFSYHYSPYTEESLRTEIYVNNKLIGTRTYDGLNRLVEEKIGDSNPRCYKYDEGYLQPSKMTTPRGDELVYRYINEMMYIPTKVENVSKQINFLYTYDPSKALVTYQENNNTSCTSRYDGNNNLVGEVFTIQEQIYQTTYERSEFGTLNSIKDPSNKKTKYFYNDKGQIVSIQNGLLSTDISYTNDFPKTIEYNTGTDVNIACDLVYDEMGREESRTYTMGDTILLKVLLAYNESSKIRERIIEYGSLNSDQTYEYDIYGRLTGVYLDGTAYPKDQYGKTIKKIEYQYDDYNNITSTITTFADNTKNEATFQYDQEYPCKLIIIQNSNPKYPQEQHLVYDASGNITYDGEATAYSYDSFEKLLNVQKIGEIIATYDNDFAGRQCMQKNNATSMTSLYSSDKLLASIEKNGEITEKINYTDINNQISCILSSKITNKDTNLEQYGLLGDAIGNNYSWLNLIDLSKKGDFCLYTPFGLGTTIDKNPIKFAGTRIDSVTGLYHFGNGNRAYDPNLMRFLQPDRLSPFDGGDINPYTYALNDPINFSDPSGNISAWAAVGIGIGVLGVVASIATLGFGMAFAPLGALAFLKTGVGLFSAASLVLDVASLGTGIASVLLEDSNPELSTSLGIASGVLGLGSLITGLGSFLKSSRVVVGKIGSIESMRISGGKMAYLYSANYKGGSLVVTHGGDGFIKNFIGKGVLGADFATELRNIPGYRAEGPLYLMSCGATKFGIGSNAQKIAHTLERQVYAFPSSYTLIWGGFSPRSVNDKLFFTGLPFSKIKSFPLNV
ncbi:RHS repeat-associated core domain-containing protein [Brevibacillus laterosporus]|uniref:RHS repeat-associated core domain-containing protein n=1 Tax=Brevibacillus laterosporus TaxID=1465 RepID=UPI0035A626A5